MNAPGFSFEFFPPKNDAAAAQLWDAMPRLAALGPKYMTVTYGAGGSTRDGTFDTLIKAQQFNIPLASHLTFINATKDDLKALTDQLWRSGVRHIVALRGDIPKGLEWPLAADANYFQYSSDFVAALRTWNDFEISVAAYPEKHPDSKNLADDIDALKKKCDAGATRAITQFFFENDKFYRFQDSCVKAGITTPICPGLLPVHDFKSMVKFAAKCQASVPAWMHEKFAALENDPEGAREYSTELLIAQAQDLAAHGVAHIHFYTLNKAEITEQVCAAISSKI
jgi:methylenetetrahydrofolate reductase (NADPH)